MNFFPSQKRVINEANKVLETKEKVMINAPTGTAKTEMMTQVVADTVGRQQKDFTTIIVTVPRIRLADQWTSGLLKNDMNKLHSTNAHVFKKDNLKLCQIHSGTTHTGKKLLGPCNSLDTLPRIVSVDEYRDFESSAKQDGYSGVLGVNVVNSAGILKSIVNNYKEFDISMLDEVHSVLSEDRLKTLGLHPEESLESDDIKTMTRYKFADKTVSASAELRYSRDLNGLGMNNLDILGEIVSMSTLEAFEQKIIVPPLVAYETINHNIGNSRSFIDLWLKILKNQQNWWQQKSGINACPIVHCENSDQIQWITEGCQKGLINVDHKVFTMSSRDGFHINGEPKGSAEYMSELFTTAENDEPFSLNHIDMVAEGINIKPINCGTFMKWNNENITGNNNRIGRGGRSLTDEIGMEFDKRKKHRNLLSIVCNGLEGHDVKKTAESVIDAICNGEDIWKFIDTPQSSNDGEQSKESETKTYGTLENVEIKTVFEDRFLQSQLNKKKHSSVFEKMKNLKSLINEMI